jgi:pyrimidine deaminase RibD-like protein
MNETDLSMVKKAIDWAKLCQPIKASIPKVGAVIAVGAEVLGCGYRGSGIDMDDEHAEWNAIGKVEQAQLPRLTEATLYTTLEPCTGSVRSRPLEACTELILQHKIKTVFIGMLDPNQGVTGKGVSKLQDRGVEVVLFPHELFEQVRALNAPFIRAQMSLGATILSPLDGEELKTYQPEGGTRCASSA